MAIACCFVPTGAGARPKTPRARRGGCSRRGEAGRRREACPRGGCSHRGEAGRRRPASPAGIVLLLSIIGALTPLPLRLGAGESEHERLSVEREDRHEIGISLSIELSGAEQSSFSLGQSVSYLFARRLSVSARTAETVELERMKQQAYLEEASLSLGLRVRRRLPIVQLRGGAGRSYGQSDYTTTYNGGGLITWITDPVLLTFSLSYFDGIQEPPAVRVGLAITEALNDRVSLSLRLMSGATYEAMRARVQPPQLLAAVSVNGIHWNSRVTTVLPNPPIATVEGGYRWRW